MKPFAFLAVLALTCWGSTAIAQSSNAGSIRVAPGHFCAINKCVRFSSDLTRVSIQARRSVSVAQLNLRANPVISVDQYRAIFSLALRQPGVNGTR